MKSSPENALLHDIEPVAGKLLDRHLSHSKSWYPEEYIPYSQARDYIPGKPWLPDDSEVPISDEVRSALVVNLLTEDNLPYYFRTVERLFGPDSSWGTWVRRWTAEEGRHSIVIRGYLSARRLVDPKKLEDDRMAQVSGGNIPDPENTASGLIYLTLQELATRIAHHNTGKELERAGDNVGLNVMKQVVKDENHHHLFYRDLASAAIEADPDTMVVAAEKPITKFVMPGAGIPDFKEHAKKIAKAGIYDLSIHYEKILKPIVVNQWNILGLTGIGAEAAEAQDRIGNHLEKAKRVAERAVSRQVRLSGAEA